MDLFNIICGICSVAGLAVSIFTASKVIKISQDVKIQENVDFSKTKNTLKDTYVGGDYAGRDKRTGR